MIKKLSAYKLYLIFSAATALFFSLVSTVMIVYHIQGVHLNPLQLILVGTTLEAACFMFEIPTGIVADVYSRKLSIVIGAFLIGIGFTLEGTVPKFAAVLASQIIWGLGATFLSGSVEAWIAEENKDMNLDQVFMRGAQAGQIGAVMGIILSTVLANFSVRLPVILSGALCILFSIFLALFMPENNFKTSAPEELNTFGKMGHTLMTSLRFIKSKPIVMLLLSVTLFYGLSSEGYDRLSTAHFLNDTTLPKLGNLQPVTWFGIFGITGMILSAVVMQLVIGKLEKNNKINSAVMLLTINVFYIFSMIVFALTRNFSVMLTGYLLTNIFRIINEPVYNAWLNNHIEENARATVLSTNGQLNALGQIIGGPIIGIIATRISIGIGIACTALLITPVVLLYFISIVMDRKDKNVCDGGDGYENN
ncbi:MFS transporter [Clostridium botulinum]|nr:MFS transporter [Clostridium botulinum]EJE7237020.1 MFS transporter [Clostridium botulinum]